MRFALRAALLVCALVSLGAVASADPLPLPQYAVELRRIQQTVELAQRSSTDERRRLLAAAVARLDTLREVQVPGAVYPDLPHAPIRALLLAGDDASLQRARGTLEETVQLVLRAAAARPGGDAAAARARLDEILRSSEFRRQPDWRDTIASLIRDFLAIVFPELRAPDVDPRAVAQALATVAVVLVALVLLSTGRGLRERMRRDGAVLADEGARRQRARERLTAAEEAARRGHLREAVRELFLFALHSLDERGALRYDAALTDREILLRAAHLSSARELESLVRVYERAAYGLRDPSPDEVARARELAQRVAA